MDHLSKIYSLLWDSGFFLAVALTAAAVFIYNSVSNRKIDSLPLYFIYLITLVWLSSPEQVGGGTLLPRGIYYVRIASAQLRDIFINALGFKGKEPYENLSLCDDIDGKVSFLSEVADKITQVVNKCYKPVAAARLLGAMTSNTLVFDEGFYRIPIGKSCKMFAATVRAQLERAIAADEEKSGVIAKVEAKGGAVVRERYLSFLAQRVAGVRERDRVLASGRGMIDVSKDVYDTVLTSMYFVLFVALAWSFVPYKVGYLALVAVLILLIEAFFAVYFIADIGFGRIDGFLEGDAFSSYDMYSRMFLVNSVWAIIAVGFVSYLCARNRT